MDWLSRSLFNEEFQDEGSPLFEVGLVAAVAAKENYRTGKSTPTAGAAPTPKQPGRGRGRGRGRGGRGGRGGKSASAGGKAEDPKPAQNDEDDDKKLKEELQKLGVALPSDGETDDEGIEE